MLFNIASSTLFIHEHIIDGRYIYHSHLYNGLPAAHSHTSAQLDILSRSAQPDIEPTACTLIPIDTAIHNTIELNATYDLCSDLCSQSSLSLRAPPVIARA
ncbi:MAG: hypothetical protein IKA81_07405 [Alistipes sp.]|nr:hypothetical protein [Alistipes sp.]